jgi:hypothetical protein
MNPRHKLELAEIRLKGSSFSELPFVIVGVDKFHYTQAIRARLRDGESSS